jgi:hypothetical protein
MKNACTCLNDSKEEERKRMFHLCCESEMMKINFEISFFLFAEARERL